MPNVQPTRQRPPQTLQHQQPHPAPKTAAATDLAACPRCGEVADLGACSSGACRNCGFRPSCSMG